LKEELNIPVFHDDQHGTAVVVLAALINALKIVGKKMSDIKVVVNGVGAAGVACTKDHHGRRREECNRLRSVGRALRRPARAHELGQRLVRAQIPIPTVSREPFTMSSKARTFFWAFQFPV